LPAAAIVIHEGLGTWLLASITLAFVIVRPFRINEAIWAISGAVLLVATGSVRASDAQAALVRGTDVYCFLIGMMALAEFARIEGVFAALAARAVTLAGGSRTRLFGLIYIVGILTTALLSNDATIVVLTPAVIAALARIDAEPLPYLYACAFVANAASFVLPISNPSNLLVFAGRMPQLLTWLRWLALPSIVAIALTYVALRLRFGAQLRGDARMVDANVSPTPRLLALVTLGLAAAVLIGVSSIGGPLGSATLAVALFAFAVAWLANPSHAGDMVRGISWPVLGLTAALFVIVAAIDDAGALASTHLLFARVAPFGIGAVIAATSNVINNLPVGLNVGETIGAVHPPAKAAYAALVGVNLGPNVSANGSLATILWLAILRRANIDVSALAFLRVGLVVTPLALAAALLAVR